MDENQEENKVKSQSVVLETIVVKSLEAIIAYVAIFFFKPVWNKIIGLWTNKDESDSKTD